MGDISDFEIGQIVELQDGRIAIVRFVGGTRFAEGAWIGVELEDDSGKNDGAVLGQRYFDCPLGHGMFVRPAAAAILEQPTPKPVRKAIDAVNGVAAAAKPRSSGAVAGGLRRQTVLEHTSAKRQSINTGTPTPTARVTGISRNIQSPSKSPTKQISSRPSSGNATLRNTSISASAKLGQPATKRTSISARSSMAVPASSLGSRAPRQSVLGTMNSSVRPVTTGIRPSANRLSTLQNPPHSSSASTSSQASGRSEQGSPLDDAAADFPSPSSHEPDAEAEPHSLSLASGATQTTTLNPKTAPHQGRTSPLQRTTISSTVQSREIEGLKTKIRLLEKKRIEDRDKLKGMDKIQGERDRFESIIQRLQAKFQPQQQELLELRKQLKEAEARAMTNENQQADVDAAVEMATLDREMAEETAEALKLELDALRIKYEEIELEVEVLREENLDLGQEMSPEERTSQGWLQMERSNDRLREALVRLRDMAQEQESESKQQIKDLSKEVQELETFRDQYQGTKEKLDQSEEIIFDLKQQLETALGAEDMIEELTEKNMSLIEQIDELKAAIDDLENLKELSDELEVNHIETEKHMQDELDYKEALYLEQVRKAVVQDEAIEDLEYTVLKFRELVTNLQTDLEEIRQSQHLTEAQASEMSSRSRAMLDLNVRLQVSASKAQVKAIDVELKRLEAEEAAAHLSIVQLFLPEAYAKDSGSVNTLLRFKRIGFKANMLHGFVKERVNGVAVPGHEDDVFACCNVLDKLVWVSAMCTRFVKYIRGCSLESFKRLEAAFYDLEPVERALNGWIEALKKDELREKQCASGLQRSIAVITHLSEVHIEEGLQEYAEDVYMRATLMQSSLENTVAAISHIKAITQTKILLPSDADEEDEEEAQHFLQRADHIISQVRSCKVVTAKAIHQLEELRTRSLALDPSTSAIVEQSESSIADLISTSCLAGVSLFNLVNEEGRTSSITYDEVIHTLSSNDSTPFSTIASKLQHTATHIQAFYNLTMTLAQTTEIATPSPPPWLLLSERIRAESATTALYEKEITQLKDELVEKNTALAMKDKVVEEMAVKVEVLEKRASSSSTRREHVRELESALDVSRATERDAVHKLQQLQQDLRSLETERETWKKTQSMLSPSAGGRVDLEKANVTGAQNDFVPVRAASTIASLRQEIASLQSVIRHLRLSSSAVALAPQANAFLDTPLLPKTKATKQARLAYEAQDALKTLLGLVTAPGSGVVELHVRPRAERLAWRPAREETRWRVGRMREQWESWRDWAADVESRARDMHRGVDASRPARAPYGASVAILNLAGEKAVRQQVRIVGTDDNYDTGQAVEVG